MHLVVSLIFQFIKERESGWLSWRGREYGVILVMVGPRNCRRGLLECSDLPIESSSEELLGFLRFTAGVSDRCDSNCCGCADGASSRNSSPASNWVPRALSIESTEGSIG